MLNFIFQNFFLVVVSWNCFGQFLLSKQISFIFLVENIGYEMFIFLFVLFILVNNVKITKVFINDWLYFKSIFYWIMRSWSFNSRWFCSIIKILKQFSLFKISFSFFWISLNFHFSFFLNCFCDWCFQILTMLLE